MITVIAKRYFPLQNKQPHSFLVVSKGVIYKPKTLVLNDRYHKLLCYSAFEVRQDKNYDDISNKIYDEIKQGKLPVDLSFTFTKSLFGEGYKLSLHELTLNQYLHSNKSLKENRLIHDV